jgi:hypothetical protein
MYRLAFDIAATPLEDQVRITGASTRHPATVVFSFEIVRRDLNGHVYSIRTRSALREVNDSAGAFPARCCG